MKRVMDRGRRGVAWFAYARPPNATIFAYCAVHIYLNVAWLCCVTVRLLENYELSRIRFFFFFFFWLSSLLLLAMTMDRSILNLECDRK